MIEEGAEHIKVVDLLNCSQKQTLWLVFLRKLSAFLFLKTG